MSLCNESPSTTAFIASAELFANSKSAISAKSTDFVCFILPEQGGLGEIQGGSEVPIWQPAFFKWRRKKAQAGKSRAGGMMKREEGRKKMRMTGTTKVNIPQGAITRRSAG
jgi:hypothetical protein